MGAGLCKEVGNDALYYQNIEELRDVAMKIEGVVGENEGGELEDADLSNRYLGLEGAVVGAEALKTNSTLRNLNLSYNQLDDDALAVICEALAKHPQIESLNLAGNKFTEKGIEFLGSLLETTQTLQTLVLFNCGLTDRDVVPLFNGLMDNASLGSLDLAMNDCTDISADFVMQCLAANKTLAHVGLRQTGVTDKRKREIEAALLEHKQFQERAVEERKLRQMDEQKKKAEEEEERRMEEEKRSEEIRAMEKEKEEMEVRERALQDEEEMLIRKREERALIREEKQDTIRQKKLQYIETAITNAYAWRANLHSGRPRDWESGFTNKPLSNTGEPNTDNYGIIRRLQPCWCEPTDSPAGYAGKLHYHCKYEQQPDPFHLEADKEPHRYEGCKRTGHHCVSVGVYAKPLQKDTAATFFSSRSPHYQPD